MKRGDRVELISTKEIENVMQRAHYMMFTKSPLDGKYAMPDVNIGDIGRVVHVAPDGLFGVAFKRCTVVCDEAMVRRVMTGIERIAEEGW